MQTKVQGAPARTVYPDLNVHLEPVHEDWHALLLKLYQEIHAGSRMRAWVEATHLERSAEDMASDSSGELAEHAGRLRDAARFLIKLAKVGA